MLLFVSQSVETQEDIDCKTYSNVLYKLTQRLREGGLCKEGQNVDQKEGLLRRMGSVRRN